MTTHTHHLWFETRKRQEIIDNKSARYTGV